MQVVKKGIDLDVEALRGFCAVTVLAFHCIAFDYIFDPGFNFEKTIVPYAPPGYFVVLVFFMLSGYVIGLTTLKIAKFDTRDYLKRRIIRIYPIYLFAVLITILFFHESLRTIIGAFFFTQNLFSVVPLHNLSLWSLNHEIVYYLLAIPILKYKIKPHYIFVGLIFLLVISLSKLHLPLILEGYIIGFSFWLTGFALSKIKINQIGSSFINGDKLYALFFLLSSCAVLNAFQPQRFFDKIHIVHATSFQWLDDMIKLDDLWAFPFCLYAIMTAAAINVQWYKYLTLFVYSISWLHLVFVIANGSFFKVPIFYVPAIFLIASTILRFSSITIFKSVSLWSNAGKISYAMYVIHMPILALIGKIDFFKGTLLSFAIRILFLLILVIPISYLLEKLIQPRISGFLMKKNLVYIGSLPLSK